MSAELCCHVSIFTKNNNNLTPTPLGADCPFICQLYRTFRDNKYIYLLLEACLGGEVWTILRNDGRFAETTAQFIIGCVLEAFEFLHGRGIVCKKLLSAKLFII